MKRAFAAVIFPLIALLLRAPAPAQAYPKTPDGELFTAITQGKVSGAQRALQDGANVDAQNQNGWTALMQATAMGYADIVKLLLDMGAGTEVKGRRGETVLQIAVINGNFEIVRMLLEKGANIEAADNDGNTALNLVHGKPEITRILQEAASRPVLPIGTQRPSGSAAQAPLDMVSGAALGDGASASGSITFRDLSELKERDMEKARIESILARYGARNLRWEELDRVQFSDLKTEFIPELLEDLKYKTAPGAPDRKILMHELVEFGCRFEATYRTAEIRTGLVITLTIKVTPGAKAFYVPAPSQPEQGAAVGEDGTVNISIRPARGQKAVYARYVLGARKGYIRVDFDTGEPTDVTEDEYNLKTR